MLAILEQLKIFSFRGPSCFVHCAYIVVEGLLFLWYFVVRRSFSFSSQALYRPKLSLPELSFRILCFFCISMSKATLYPRQSLQQEVAALLENL